MFNVYQFVTNTPIVVQSNYQACISMAGYYYNESVYTNPCTVAVTRLNWFKTLKKLPGNTLIHHAIRTADNVLDAVEFIRSQYADNPRLIREIIPSFILNQIL